ncbi:hypothetical protein [Aeromonas phage SW69-9]|nr:hypothetical protein [Aeromonas phage SW69-9]
MQFYKFKDDPELIEEFINGTGVNKVIHRILGKWIFGLVNTGHNSHFIAIDRNGQRINSGYDYEFNASEVRKYLEITDAPLIESGDLIEWVKNHNLGELPFGKVLKMYEIAVGEI